MWNKHENENNKAHNINFLGTEYTYNKISAKTERGQYITGLNNQKLWINLNI